MAKRRERPAQNPLLKDRVAAIVSPTEHKARCEADTPLPIEPIADVENMTKEGTNNPLEPVQRRKRETKVQIKARPRK